MAHLKSLKNLSNYLIITRLLSKSTNGTSSWNSMPNYYLICIISSFASDLHVTNSLCILLLLVPIRFEPTIIQCRIHFPIIKNNRDIS